MAKVVKVVAWKNILFFLSRKRSKSVIRQGGGGRDRGLELKFQIGFSGLTIKKSTMVSSKAPIKKYNYVLIRNENWDFLTENFESIWNDSIPNDIKWFGIIWIDIVWFELVWIDMVWIEFNWHKLVWINMTWHELKWLDTISYTP